MGELRAYSVDFPIKKKLFSVISAFTLSQFCLLCCSIFAQSLASIAICVFWQSGLAGPKQAATGQTIIKILIFINIIIIIIASGETMMNQTKHPHARLSWRALSVSFIIKEWAKSRYCDHVPVIEMPSCQT